MGYDYFEVTREIETYVENGDLIALRAILVGIINRDPTFATKRFEEAIDYLSIQKGINIWENYQMNSSDECEVKSSKWDQSYYYELITRLSQNFARERIEYIKTVGIQVFDDEYTWGKDEAQNFHRPVAQEKNNIKKTISVTGILLAIIIIIIVAIFLS